MILLDQLNCMTLLAVVCLDWKLQLVEEDGRGGLEWAPNCKIQIQISCTSEITGVRAHVWSRCFAYLKVCLSFSFSVIDLLEIHLALKWLGSLLQLSNVRVRIMEGKLLCLELIWIKDVCMYVSVRVLHFLLRRSQISCHMAWEWGRGTTRGWEAVCINMSKYILTNAFDVPVRIESSPWDRGQLSATDLRGVYEQINLCRLSICWCGCAKSVERSRRKAQKPTCQWQCFAQILFSSKSYHQNCFSYNF